MSPAKRSQPALRLICLQLLAVALFIGLWQLASSTIIDPYWVGKPSRVAERLVRLAADGSLSRDFLATGKELLLGTLFGSLVAILFAVTLRIATRIGGVIRPFITVAYSFPQLAIAPLYILWFGVFSTSKVVLVAVVTFFVMFFSVFEGLSDVDPNLIRSLRVIGGNSRDLLRIVVTPSVFLFVTTGLRHAVPFGFRAVVFGELLASTAGLGHLIGESSAQFDTNGIFAGLVVILAMAMVLNALVNSLESLTQRWRG